jgi:hypothetical protein
MTKNLDIITVAVSLIIKAANASPPLPPPAQQRMGA